MMLCILLHPLAYQTHSSVCIQWKHGNRETERTTEEGGCLKRVVGVPGRLKREVGISGERWASQEGGGHLRREVNISGGRWTSQGGRWVSMGDKVGHWLLVRKQMFKTLSQAPGALGRQGQGAGRCKRGKVMSSG